MMKRINCVVLLFLLGCLPLLLNAQKLTVNHSNVRVNATQTFVIEYKLEGGSGDIIIPAFSNFFVVGGPNQFSSFSMVNGKTTSYKTVSVELQPEKTGSFVIPPAQVKTRKAMLKSPMVKVTVTPAPKSNNQSAQGGSNNAIGGVNPNGPLFFVAEVDTTNFYIGQQITLKYTLYSQYDLTNYNISQSPSFQGYWVEDVTPKRINPTKKTFGNQIYNVYVLKKYALFPQRSGELELEGLNAKLTLRQYSQSRNSFFRNYKNINRNVNCQAIKINVYQLPEKGKPTNFSGAVGKYRFVNRLSKNRCQTDDAVEYTVNVSGTGNLMLIDLPKPEFPANFDVYEPELSENIYPRDDVLTGSKIHTYTVIPSEKGHHLIPKLPFNYFNPETGEYVEIPGRALSLMVSQNADVEEEVIEEEVEVFEDIAQNTSLKSSASSSAWLPIFSLMYLVPFFVFPVLVYRKKQEIALASDVVGNKRKWAVVEAQKRLSAAEGLKNQSDKKAFYNEILNALWSYVSDKLNIEQSLLNKDYVATALNEKGIETALTDKLKSTIEYCEMAIYAPLPNADNFDSTYQNCVELISEIEEGLEIKIS